jgi:hypothetical protein
MATLAEGESGYRNDPASASGGIGQHPPVTAGGVGGGKRGVDLVETYAVPK